MTSASSNQEALLTLMQVAPSLNRLLGQQLYRKGSPLLLPQLLVLQCISEGHVSATDIAREITISKTAIQLTTEWLISRGLIRREQSKLDRRRYLFELTPEGETLRAASNDIAVDVISELALRTQQNGHTEAGAGAS